MKKKLKIIGVAGPDHRKRYKVWAIWNGKKKYWSITSGLFEVICSLSGFKHKS